MRRFLETRDDIDYTGVDIVSKVIARHRAVYADRPTRKFLNLDVVSDPINVSDYDVIMTRMMMQHLTHADVIRILRKLSDVTSGRDLRRPVFLMATTFSSTVTNARLDVNNSMRFELLNLEIEPFRLSPPLCLFRDGPPKSVHFMGLWRLPLKVVAQTSCTKPVAVSTPLSRLPLYSCINWSLPTGV